MNNTPTDRDAMDLGWADFMLGHGPGRGSFSAYTEGFQAGLAHARKDLAGWPVQYAAPFTQDMLSPAVAQEYPFGAALQDMDLEVFFNLRDWLREALKKHGAEITGGGMGMGAADVDIKIDGAPFFVSIKPMQIGKP